MLDHELYTVACFAGIGFAGHVLGKHYSRPREQRIFLHPKHRRNLCIKVAASLSPLFGHPVILETCRDYAVHLIVYSGYVLR